MNNTPGTPLLGRERIYESRHFSRAVSSTKKIMQLPPISESSITGSVNSWALQVAHTHTDVTLDLRDYHIALIFIICVRPCNACGLNGFCKAACSSSHISEYLYFRGEIVFLVRKLAVKCCVANAPIRIERHFHSRVSEKL